MSKARKKGAFKKGVVKDDPTAEDAIDDEEEEEVEATIEEEGVEEDAVVVGVEEAVAEEAVVPMDVADTAAMVAESIVHPTDRDVILGEGSAGHKTNFLLEDMIRLHRILWTLHSKPKPSTAAEIQPMVERIISIIQNGKSFELAGLKDVPKPFMRSKGRFLGKDPVTGSWRVLSDQEVNTIITDVILDEFKMDDLGPLTESPYSDLKEWINKSPSVAAVDFLPEAKDAILLPVDQEADKMYETQQGNKTLFHLASQLVTSHTNNPDKRVEAAINIMRGLDETLESMGTGDAMAKVATTTLKARFLVRTLRDDRSVAWHLMDPASAAEFTVIFVFEVFLEKEIHCTDTDKAYSFGVAGLTADGMALEDLYDDHGATSKPSLVPIQEPTDHDVLFGRGGMTNRYAGIYGEDFVLRTQ
jgi:hypothetical protein